MKDIKLSEMLKEAFAKYSQLEIFPEITYGDFLSCIVSKHHEWDKHGFTDRDIVVFADCGNYENFLAIITALYFDLKICLVHNRMFVEKTLAHLENLGIVSVMENDGNIVGIVKLNDDFDVEFIASTSGTTGTPNLVQHKKINILRNMFAIEEYLHIQERDTVYLQRNPIYLSVLTGEVLLGINRGCRFIIKDGLVAPNKLLSDVATYDVKLLVSVMSYFDSLLPMIRKNRECMQKMKYLQFVGEGGRESLIDDLSELLPETDIIIGYGLTECGPRVSYMSSKEMSPKQYLVGKLVDGTDARIVDQSGTILPAGEKGTVEVKSNSLMLGYVGKEHCKEWFRTSDYGWIDENKLLYICGRLDDIVIINGVKVPLVSVEQEIMKSGMVTGAYAFAATSEDDSRTRINVIITSENKSPNLCTELTKWCRHNLNEYLWPHKIHITDNFCFKPNGKLDKAATKKKVMGE